MELLWMGTAVAVVVPAGSRVVVPFVSVAVVAELLSVVAVTMKLQMTDPRR